MTNDQIEEKSEQEKIQKEDELYEEMRKKAENEVVAEFKKIWGDKPNNVYHREAKDLLRRYAHIRGVADVLLDSDAKSPQTEDEVAAGVISAYKIAMGNTNSEGQLDKYGINKGALAYTTGNSADWKEFSKFGRYFTNEPANKQKGVVTWSQACELIELSCEQQHIVMRMSGDEALQEMLSKASVDIYHTTAAAGVSNYILIKRIEQAREAARQWEAENDEWRAQTNLYFSTNLNEEASELSDEDVRFSVRTEPAPKKTGIGYKVFFRGKDGKLYPPMVANPNGEDTPIGIWLNADEGKRAADSKTGRPQVKQGGKGTQGGSGTLAYRPCWHLGEIPYALQFNRKDKNGDKTLFPKDFVWAEVEYAMDYNYQEEAMKEGMNPNGKFQHSLAGLKRIPIDGYYKYRTNPNPATDPWIITGAMKVNRILTKDEVDDLVRKAGREPQRVERDDSDVRFAVKTENIEEINKEFNDKLERLSKNDVLYLGFPSKILQSVGVSKKQLKLYANKLFAKAKKHSFKITDIKDLPLYLQKPLAIFKGNHDNSFAALTEIVINGNPALCTIEIGKGGADIEFNLITSVYDKDKNKLANWINNERLLYVGNKKALRDLCNSAPIAETASDEALISAAKVIQNFENPPINSEKNSENLQGGEDVRFSVAIKSADPFMSNAAVALESIKQDKATGEQWLAMLQKNGGLKTEENVRFAIIENGIGRSLTADEAMYVISNMEKKAIYPVRIELTEQNWLKEFEETGIISTPIGDVKFGDNQFSKMNQKDRITKLGMIKPTLQNPDFIVEDKRLPKDGSVPNRETAFVFVKSFLKEDGSRLYYFASVTVKKGNNEVIISNQEKSKSRIKRLLVNGKLAYINNSTLPSESNTSTQGDKPVNHVGGISGSKGTINSRTDQTNSEKNSENLQDGDNMVFSVTPEQDAEYMRAVESGNTEKAGQMVKATFKAKYPNTKVVDENGEPLVVYHTSGNRFTKFVKERIGEQFDGMYNLGFYFTNDDSIRYGNVKYDSYLNIKNPLIISGEGWGSAIGQADSRIGDLKRWAKEGGHDGIIVESTDFILENDNGKEFTDKVFIAFEPNQIKSADPITYDNKGNVIPLSERFNVSILPSTPPNFEPVFNFSCCNFGVIDIFGDKSVYN